MGKELDVHPYNEILRANMHIVSLILQQVDCKSSLKLKIWACRFRPICRHKFDKCGSADFREALPNQIVNSQIAVLLDFSVLGSDIPMDIAHEGVTSIDSP